MHEFAINCRCPKGKKIGDETFREGGKKQTKLVMHPLLEHSIQLIWYFSLAPAIAMLISYSHDGQLHHTGPSGW
jgi:hypothetical protein